MRIVGVGPCVTVTVAAARGTRAGWPAHPAANAATPATRYVSRLRAPPIAHVIAPSTIADHPDPGKAFLRGAARFSTQPGTPCVATLTSVLLRLYTRPRMLAGRLASAQAVNTAMLARLRRDIQAVFERDPAARSTVEVLLCYPGLHAVIMHRFANWMWRHRVHLAARFFSHIARFLTGIEIHPGAKIGEGVFIDHGMAVVIGETSEIGDGCTLYQGATLGGTGHQKGKRHPTLGDNVTVGAGAKVLGNITIGDNSMVGSGAVVLRPVPANATAVGVPARVIILEGKHIDPLQHGDLPDPVAQQFRAMAERLAELEKRLRALERRARQPIAEEV